ncbi:hypothetical protein [Arthrobacter bambusae]|uniref:hypothetical protein n=1 Tax=Arthrobacter bambusae TaxID=1338426 RepID=UPI0035219D70
MGSFVGLISSGRSSGCSRPQGSITKSGIAQVRRLLWSTASYKPAPACSRQASVRSQRARPGSPRGARGNEGTRACTGSPTTRSLSKRRRHDSSRRRLSMLSADLDSCLPDPDVCTASLVNEREPPNGMWLFEGPLQPGGSRVKRYARLTVHGRRRIV